MSASRVSQGRHRGSVPCESARDRAWRSRRQLVVIACEAPHGRSDARSAIWRQKTVAPTCTGANSVCVPSVWKAASTRMVG